MATLRRFCLRMEKKELPTSFVLIASTHCIATFMDFPTMGNNEGSQMVLGFPRRSWAKRAVDEFDLIVDMVARFGGLLVRWRTKPTVEGAATRSGDREPLGCISGA